QDTPPFILKPLAANKLEYTGEKLTFIISPKPIEGIEIGSSAKRLSQDLFLQWQKDWQVSVEQFSMKGGVGKGYTKEEKTAGSDPKLIFTQDDPMPQNLFRIGKGATEPVLFSIVIPTESK
ncbi:MAG: hypothetical protein JNN15_20820, partial [Blastocatellia bacterium]|nr:hypothetical protein [Blastocatellia bacterium]